ncbi:hypothetical protein E4U41_006059 [Claviceps citrina]|nr:hypothetical protein E4U41_006059 [Claviceps citrina]
MSHGSGERVSTRNEVLRLSLGVSDAGPTGVGGAAGTKKAGRAQTLLIPFPSRPGGAHNDGNVRVGRKEYIRSVPRELSHDQAAAVEAAQVLGYVSVGMLADNLGWERARCRTVIDDLVAEGMVWVDKQTGGEWEYWSPTFMVDAEDEEEASPAAAAQL